MSYYNASNDPAIQSFNGNNGAVLDHLWDAILDGIRTMEEPRTR